MSTSQPGTPLSQPTPLLFALFWNGFTAVHAFFMMRAAWGSGAMFFLVPFYGIFFGAGYWMLKSRLNYLALQRRYGSPTLSDTVTTKPGDPVRLAVQFDRPWAADTRLDASLQWVVRNSKGSVMSTSAAQTIAGQVFAQAEGTCWQANAVIPAPTELSGEGAQLELHLYQPGLEKQGWRWWLQMQEPHTELRELTPEQKTQALRVMGWMSPVLLIAALALVVSALAAERLSPFRLFFAGGPLLGMYLLAQFRRKLATEPTGGRDNTPLNKGKFQRLASAYFGLMFILFFADVFLPHDLLPDHPGLRLLAFLQGNDYREPAHEAAPAVTTSTSATSPAVFAVQGGDYNTLRDLLNQGTDANTVSPLPGNRGENLLMLAARSRENSVEMIELLLSHGARLDTLDSYGKNATDWAEFFGNAAASDALCRHGLEPTALDPSSPNNEVHKRTSCAAPSTGH